MIGYRTHWYGKEVEGRFTDIETLFIADMKATYEKLTLCAHIYICSPATKQLIDRNKIFEKELKNKLDDFYAALNWGAFPENNNAAKFFSFGK